ncbi:hypothetical protein E2C01_052560 [Portunus trituberculatus]|uniref:Uncharacterized protein n=1 Tax=Portunus trituberculatus TaxID=210409 RepID=A0A5B7GPP7_PORTR|nr:hypothetical protein [Portunus trituberculatus]
MLHLLLILNRYFHVNSSSHLANCMPPLLRPRCTRLKFLNRKVSLAIFARPIDLMGSLPLFSVTTFVFTQFLEVASK